MLPSCLPAWPHSCTVTAAGTQSGNCTCPHGWHHEYLCSCLMETQHTRCMHVNISMRRQDGRKQVRRRSYPDAIVFPRINKVFGPVIEGAEASIKSGAAPKCAIHLTQTCSTILCLGSNSRRYTAQKLHKMLNFTLSHAKRCSSHASTFTSAGTIPSDDGSHALVQFKVNNEFSPVKHKIRSSDAVVLYDRCMDALEAVHALRL